MQIVYNEDNLHEISDPVLVVKYFKMSSAENLPQSTKR